MVLNFYEKVQRNYNNGVAITYEYLNNNDLYIHSINSTLKKMGYGTEVLKSFIEEYKGKNIYIFASSELGTEESILNKWYEKLGFNQINNLDYIPYNITHVKTCN